MSTIFDTMAVVFECAMSSMFNFIVLILNEPYLLIGLSLMLIGVAVSFLKRLIRV